MSSRWIIHLKDGRTLTDRDAYPHDISNEQITSVERIVNGKVYTIKNSPVLKNFFVKSTEGKTLALFTGGTRPAVVYERILGCFVEGKDGPIRLELTVDARTGNCKLIAVPTKKITKDGF